MPLAIDLIGVGMAPEEAIREGDTGPLFISTSVATPGLFFTGQAASTATTIGGANGATILEIQGSASSALVFSSSTERDRWYTIYNTGSNAVNIFCPIGSSFQSATGSVQAVSVGGVNFVFRLGAIGAAGSVSSDRWIFK